MLKLESLLVSFRGVGRKLRSLLRSQNASVDARTESAFNSCAVVDRERSPSFAKVSLARSALALRIGDAALRSATRDTRHELPLDKSGRMLLAVGEFGGQESFIPTLCETVRKS
jgi:hypothetical protein